MIGFQGREIPQWMYEFESRFGLGGVILFDYSIRNQAYDNNIFDKAQLTELCAAIHALPSRPMIYIDQEGGKVRRLKDKHGYALLPNQYALSQKPPEERCALLEACYREMKEIGID